MSDAGLDRRPPLKAALKPEAESQLALAHGILEVQMSGAVLAVT